MYARDASHLTEARDNILYLLIFKQTKMKKKLLTLLTLLLVAVTGVWATETTVTFTSSNKNDANNAFASMSNGNSQLVGGGLAKLIATNSVALNAANNKYGYRCDGSRLYIVFKFTGTTSLTIQHNTNSTGQRYMRLYSFSSEKELSAITSSDWNTKTQKAFSSTSTTSTWGGGQSSAVTIPDDKLSWNYSTKGCLEVTWSNLSAGYYVMDGTGSEAYIYGFTADVAPVIPTLTGAWKIDDNVVTSTTVVQGSSAPTMPTFTVGATSGTPSAADNYNVVYSLKTGSTEGIFTFTEGVPTAISTSTAGSATLIATLTTKDATAFYTPETNTFEYTVNVSAAEAPTINVSGAPANAIVVGTEVTLTATATGTPTPTVKWYDGNDTEVGTGDTYVVNTDNVGTYRYYAVASNGVGTDATSAIQTIVVKEQVATPTISPNGAYFETSQEVTLTCNTADATIKYSTDNGSTWTDYTTALTFTETTTLKAKAVKEGCIDSEVATATFTKVTLVAQTDVTGLTEWDWATVTNSSAVDFTDTALNNVDVLYANISAYGQTAVTAPAAFNQTALLMNGQRAYNSANGSKHCQVNYLKFNTTVAGKVTVEYANTGNKDSRTVNVNGTKGSKSVDSNTTYQTETFNVEAGAVTIKGVQVSDDADKMLRIRKVTFIPTVASIDITPARTYTTLTSAYALDFTGTGLKAFIVKDNDLSDDAVTMTEVSKVPAGTGLVLKATTTGSAISVPVLSGTADDVTGNLMKGSATQATAIAANAGYILSYGEFHPSNGEGKLAAGKAYLNVAVTGARALVMVFDGESPGISTIDNRQPTTINGEVFTLRGQRVAQPTKGLYIVGGRKVVIK